MNQKKSKQKNSLLTASIILIGLGVIISVGEETVSGLLIIGILLLVLHILIKKGQKQQADSADHTTPGMPKAKKPQRNFSQPSRPKFVPKAHRTERNHDEHRIEEPEEFSFRQHTPHSDYADLRVQARREIANLRNIRYALSELTNKTLSDSVLWHNNNGVCSSVVQVIRQGNLRYPDLSDRELSERILADEDLMAYLERSLEWERSTELR